MNFPLIALVDDFPPGFERRQTLLPRDLRRGVFALFVNNRAAAEAALEPFRGKVVGLIVTAGERLEWAECGQGLYHLRLPRDLHGALPELLWPYLQTLQRILDLTELHRQEALDLARAAEDRARLYASLAGCGRIF